MALYTTELAAEAMRERMRAEIMRAKQMVAVQRERQRAELRQDAAEGSRGSTMDAGVLAGLTRAELYAHAKQIGLRGRSKMNKKQLIEAVRHDW